MLVLQIIVFLLGLGIALTTLYSAIKQTVLPGRKKVRLSRAVFRNTFRLYRLLFARVQSDEARDAIMAFYAPLSVMLLPLTWAILLIIGFTTMFWAVSEPSLGTALSLSGAAITTEGFLAPKGAAQTTLYIVAGVIGLGIVGLLITFLPTVYSIYSQREEEVTRIAFRFGSPPSGVKVLEQAYCLGLAQELDQFWHTWEDWFTDMAETHISNSEVIFYRSSQPGTSWITTAYLLSTFSPQYGHVLAEPILRPQKGQYFFLLGPAPIPAKDVRISRPTMTRTTRLRVNMAHISLIICIWKLSCNSILIDVATA